MVSCKQCGMHNSLDSTFCKKCGTAVSPEEVQEARAKLDVLVVEGNTAFNDGRTDEAMAISESVLLSDPDNTSALWLRAICHERLNEIGLALECAERIVELNPNSDLDRIRRNHLRNKLATTLAVAKPDRRVALVGAIAAAVLVVCIGILVANGMQGRQEPDYVASNNAAMNLDALADEQEASPNVNSAHVQNPVQQGVDNPQQNNTGLVAGNNSGLRSTPQPGDVPALGQPQRPTVRQASNVQPNLPSISGNGELPMPEGGIGPVKVDPSTVAVSQPKPKANVATNDPDPDTTFEAGDANVVAQNDPGDIEINVYNGSRNSAKAPETRNGSEAQRRTAYEAFQLGNYSQAANLFEQALRSGGDPVSLNQRLGQSYERLGQAGQAIEAYRRAVQAGEAALAQGKANPSGIKSIVDSCRQALKKLGG